MTESQEQFDHTVPSRVAKLESDGAAMRSDIRGIFAGLDEIRDVLVRMQENARPNLGGLFVVLLATCTFLVTIGGLTMAPVFRELGRIDNESNTVSTILLEHAKSLSRVDTENKFIRFELGKLEALSLERHGYQKDRMDRIQNQLDIIKKAYIAGNNRSEE